MKTLETVISAADGAPVIAHIGAIGTKLSEELAVHAEKAGASMISSVPPFYFSYDFESIKRYYWDLADSVKLPLMIYYIPSNTGHQLSAAQLAEIMDGTGKYYFYQIYEFRLLQNAAVARNDQKRGDQR